jgi:hypothetical protein
MSFSARAGEDPCCRLIAGPAQVRGNSMPLFVDRSVQVYAAAVHLIYVSSALEERPTTSSNGAQRLTNSPVY